MKTFKIDLDYESFLFNPEYNEHSPATQKKQREFEYVFFLINDDICTLKNCRPYSAVYLKKLKDLGFTIPILSPQAEFAQNWWGHHHDLAIEKKCNSKLTSMEMAQRHGWGFVKGTLVQNEKELQAHLQKFPEVEKWILKNPYGFSGIGHYSFKRNEFKMKITESMLLEPSYQRVFDIGTTFLIEDGKILDWFMVENFNNVQGSFRGGAGSSNKEVFRNYIQQKYHYDLAELENITNEIAQVYLKEGVLKNIQIDSFIYQDSGELKLYPLVEVNYRKTMGLVIQSLANKLGRGELIEWRVSTKKDTPQGDNWIQLSPDDNHFVSNFCICCKEQV